MDSANRIINASARNSDHASSYELIEKGFNEQFYIQFDFSDFFNLNQIDPEVEFVSIAVYFKFKESEKYTYFEKTGFFFSGQPEPTNVNDQFDRPSQMLIKFVENNPSQLSTGDYLVILKVNLIADGKEDEIRDVKFILKLDEALNVYSD